MATATDNRRTLTVPEVASILGISVRHCYDVIREGQLPSLRLGSRVLVPADQLEKLLAGDELSEK